MKVVCAECMKMCCLGGKNSVVKGLSHSHLFPVAHARATGFRLPAKYLNFEPTTTRCQNKLRI